MAKLEWSEMDQFKIQSLKIGVENGYSGEMWIKMKRRSNEVKMLNK